MFVHHPCVAQLLPRLIDLDQDVGCIEAVSTIDFVQV